MVPDGSGWFWSLRINRASELKQTPPPSDKELSVTWTVPVSLGQHDWYFQGEMESSERLLSGLTEEKSDLLGRLVSMR